MTKSLTLHLFLPVLLVASSAIGLAKTPPTAADIKPAANPENIDEEEMRLAKIIHKRVIEKQKKAQPSNKTAFTKYQDNIEKELNLDMIPIKGGQFDWQGEQADDTLKVTLSSFWMASREITWDEYNPFMMSKPDRRQKDGHLEDFIRDQVENEIDFLARSTVIYFPIAGGMPKNNEFPVVSMTQHAANKYCQWLSYKTGHFYRLPTEAEWEYACQAGKKTKFSWGNDAKKASEYAWLDGDDKSFYQITGKKKPNLWGLYDMHGNVMEWTLDQYVSNRKKHFQKDNVTNPWVRATSPYPHVVKGGHWKQKAEELTASSRGKSNPKWKIRDPQEPKSLWYHTDAQMLGFRIVRPVAIPTAEEMYRYWNNGVAEDGTSAAYKKGHPLYKPNK